MDKHRFWKYAGIAVSVGVLVLACGIAYANVFGYVDARKMLKAMDNSTASSLDAFRRLDSDADGSLSYEELKRAYDIAATAGLNATANSTDATVAMSGGYGPTEANPGLSEDPASEYLQLAGAFFS